MLVGSITISQPKFRPASIAPLRSYWASPIRKQPIFGHSAAWCTKCWLATSCSSPARLRAGAKTMIIWRRCKSSLALSTQTSSCALLKWRSTFSKMAKWRDSPLSVTTTSRLCCNSKIRLLTVMLGISQAFYSPLSAHNLKKEQPPRLCLLTPGSGKTFPLAVLKCTFVAI